MRAVEIARVLAGRVDSVVANLLPNGRRVGQEWRVGGIEGDAGKSMGVHLTGEKAGVWLDGETGQCGDLIGLWMACKRVDLRTACKDAMEFCGIRDDDRPSHHAKSYRKPDKAGVSAINGEHTQWLHSVRNLPNASLVAYKLASRGDRLMFPYIRDGELVFAKYRKLPKFFSAEADCEPILFGWQAIPPDARAVVLCEGELDAIAWHAYGFPCLSVPTGSGAHKWIEGEFDNLSVFDKIYLSMDMDAAGQKAIPEICERLGRDRVRVVVIPFKDANECLMEGVSASVMAEALRDARTQDPSELRNVGEFEDAVIAEMHRIDEGMVLPWKKTYGLLKLRPGETSIWAGINGHGKSGVVTNIIADLAVNGHRCCVVSMEFRTPVWIMRMARLISGTGTPTDTYMRQIVHHIRENLWAFDVSGAAKAKRIIEVFRYARKRYGIDLFVIDNLTKCGFDDDDYTGQKRFVEELSDFARVEETHVAIVAHMRKGENEDQPAGKMSVKGSGGITDMADTVIEIWRNKPRERAMLSLEQHGTPIPDKIGKADTYINVLKQRATGLEPSIALWFDKGSTQFLSGPDFKPRPLMHHD